MIKFFKQILGVERRKRKRAMVIHELNVVGHKLHAETNCDFYFHTGADGRLVVHVMFMTAPINRGAMLLKRYKELHLQAGTHLVTSRLDEPKDSRISWLT